MSNIPADLKFQDLLSYQSVIDKLAKRKTPMHLIMGNGFSIAYDPNIFSYNALYDFIEQLDDEVLSKLFKVINNKNFELVMRQLENFIEIAKIFNTDSQLVADLSAAKERLQSSLIQAVSELHPEHVFEVNEEKSMSCFSFIKRYIDKHGEIFSTNYDLLLYWILMRNDSTIAIDGFGRELLNPDEVKYGKEEEWSELYWGKNKEEQNIHYLHGTLPFFDTGTTIEKEVYKNRNYLLDNIKDRMQKQDYPIFVTSGNGEEKLNHIMHNSYLTYCYEQLSKITGSLVSFGFNFGEYDHHIIDAINKAAKHGAQSGEKLFSIYIGVYSETDLEYIKSIEGKFKCKVNVYNSRTANIWMESPI
ncbi:DUF4917 family protein [Bacteroides ihuae]|uniref:DUF4917 family protein n=1 Tax=Bacteroides ihuae TaxID=1852362 RepID=UPI0008D92703|nr:DUF4917 family protein [Bacteroides ihuae]